MCHQISLKSDVPAEYIVQGHRFNIFEDIGCYPFTYNVPPAYALVSSWPLVIGLVSAVYCSESHQRDHQVTIKLISPSSEHSCLHPETITVQGVAFDQLELELQPILPSDVSRWY